MASKKKDFTAADKSKYAGFIGGIDTSDTTDTTATNDTTPTTDTANTTGTASTESTKGTRTYTRLDPRNEPPKEYRFTARMPGEYGRFLNELAYQRRSTITAELQRLVKEEMERRPEILKSLDELNN